MNENEPSLLSHLEEIREAHTEDGEGYSTVIYCGKVQAGVDVSIAALAHRNIVEDVSEDDISGMLIPQGNSILHILEGKSETIVGILSHLGEHEHFSSSEVQSGRIVYCVEDRPQRCFPGWFNIYDIEDRKVEGEEVTNDNAIDVVHEMATNLIEVGRVHLSSDDDLSRYADRLPIKTLVTGLADSTLFFTLQEFVEMYATPYHVELDSEKTWPLERLVQY